MDIHRDIDRGLKILQDGGPGKFAQTFLDYTGLWKPVWNTITSRYPVGTNIFEQDWDLLVILDACRVDALREVSNSINWIDSVGEIWSVGSMSAEWMLNTFTREYWGNIKDTAFVSGNIWSHRILEDQIHKDDKDHDELGQYGINHGIPDWGPVVSTDAFEHYETVYLSYEEAFQPPDQDRLHPDYGPVPHLLTDRAISVGREKDIDRLIVHYNLPHSPYIADAVNWSPGEITQEELMSGLSATRELKQWEKRLEPGASGKISKTVYHDGYIKNLQLILEYVDILRKNIDAEKMIIGADHGEGLGEGVWGHPFGYPFRPVKNVPWATGTAVDTRTYESKHDEIGRAPSQRDQEKFLEQMGYL